MKTPPILLALSLYLLINPAHADALDLTGVQRELERWSGDRPGAIVALAFDGTDRGFVAAGRWADDAPDRVADAHTAFEVGSITKVFTALLASEAVAAGGLAWDQPLGEPFASSPITPAMLATHTAGLPALPEDFPAQDLVDPYVTEDRDDLLAGYAATVQSTDLAALPAAWSYSNLGAAVLGQAAAGALGGDYRPLVQERLLGPLAMAATWFSVPGSAMPDTMAPGFNADGAASRWRFDGYAPAGALVSTAADMERFMRAMLVAPEPWATTMAKRAATGGADAMGYGWFIREIDGSPVFWHGGGTGGYRSFLGVQPATGRGIVVLAARDQDVAGIGMGWFQGLFAHDGEAAGAVAAADYVGDYPLAPQFVLRVFERDGRLLMQATAQPAFALIAADADSFAVDGVPARVVFGRDERGVVTGLTLQQAGREMPAPRREAGSVSSDRQGVMLSETQLAGLAGEYELAPQVTATVTRDGGQVFVRLTGQPTLPIFASGPDQFYYTAVEARISFQRDADGDVTGLTLHQNGQDLPAKKR